LPRFLCQDSSSREARRHWRRSSYVGISKRCRVTCGIGDVRSNFIITWCHSERSDKYSLSFLQVYESQALVRKKRELEFLTEQTRRVLSSGRTLRMASITSYGRSTRVTACWDIMVDLAISGQRRGHSYIRQFRAGNKWLPAGCNEAHKVVMDDRMPRESAVRVLVSCHEWRNRLHDIGHRFLPNYWFDRLAEYWRILRNARSLYWADLGVRVYS
jgi:hypothetical protein